MVGGCCDERIEIEFENSNNSRKVAFGRNARHEFAGVTNHISSDEQLSGSPWVQRAVVTLSNVDLNANRGRDDSNGVECISNSGRHSRLTRLLRDKRACEQCGDVARLGWNTAVERSQGFRIGSRSSDGDGV